MRNEKSQVKVSPDLNPQEDSPKVTVKNTKLKKLVEKILAQADIRINGDRPWDIQVHNEEVYRRVFSNGSLGFGEAYMDGWWDCDSINELVFRILHKDLNKNVQLNKRDLLNLFINRLFNLQKTSRAYQIAEKHYDLSNELYAAMLDKTMTYSCGYWKDARNLEQAQQDKLELICEKLKLRTGMTLLDIGCGWGGLAKYAAENYGVKVTGITVSKEQQQLAAKICAGLPVTILLQDYRLLQGEFDRVVSVGMFEHVGHKNYAEYMQVVARCLKSDGLFLLHTIGNNEVGISYSDAWIAKYIFPNGVLPKIQQIITASEKLFIMEDWHNFGPDYEKTLLAWYHNFQQNWPKLQNKFDQRFFRMWKYYLLSCAGTFRARRTQLWQIVFTRHNLVGGYSSVR